MRFVKGLLQRMQLISSRKAFDSGDRMAIGLHREDQTGAYRAAVEQHRAGTAHAVLTPDVGAGEAELLSQEIAQQQARLDRALE
jgi:hypothetical protein